jgi:hypothetical protein
VAGGELTAAEAKELEAATANSRQPVIAVIKVSYHSSFKTASECCFLRKLSKVSYDSVFKVSCHSLYMKTSDCYY